MRKQRNSIVIVGCGGITPVHVRAYQRSGCATITGLCDTNEAAAAKLAKAWGIPNIYNDINKVFEEQTPTVIDICTPPSSHKALSLLALEHGSNVLVEKPFVLDVKDAEEIQQKAKEKGKRVGVVHSLKGHPIITRGLKLVKKGVIGDLRDMHNEYCEPQSEPLITTEKHWTHSLNGGRWGENMPHFVYLANLFMGNLSLQNVLANKSPNYFPWIFADSIIINFLSDKGFVTIDLSANNSRRVFSIYLHGTDGIMKLNLHPEDFNISIWKTRSERMQNMYLSGLLDDIGNLTRGLSLKVAAFPRYLLKRRIAEHDFLLTSFLESLNGIGEPPVSDEEALYTVKITGDICNQF